VLCGGDGVDIWVILCNISVEGQMFVATTKSIGVADSVVVHGSSVVVVLASWLFCAM